MIKFINKLIDLELIYKRKQMKEGQKEGQGDRRSDLSSYGKKNYYQRNGVWYILNAGNPVGIDLYFSKQKGSGSRPTGDRILVLSDYERKELSPAQWKVI